MKLTRKQQDRLPDWASYEEVDGAGIVIVDGDRAYAEIINALDLPTTQDSAEVARRWTTERLLRLLFTFGLVDTSGETIASGLSYREMAAMKSEIPNSSKVIEGSLKVRYVGTAYRLCGLPMGRTRHAENWRIFTAQLLQKGLI